MILNKSARATLLSGAAILAMLAAPAHAQDAAGAPAADSEGTDAAPGAGLQEIVVTATKRETNLQKTPIAISVVGSEAIQDRHVQSLIDLADGGVPSLRIATFEARQSALTVGIRGIVPFDANQTARDQGVGVYLDGIYLGRQQGLNAALFDIERVEVLKGPQGTLFGRNTEGGAVSLVSKAPTGQFDGRLSAGVGNYGSYTTEGHFDLPEFHNVSLKFDGLVQHQDPTVKNPLPGQSGWNAYHRYGGRVSALWKPFDGFSALLSYDQSRDENTPFYSQLINYNPNGYTVGQYDKVTNKLVAPGSPAGTNTACATCVAPLAPAVQVHPDRQTVADVGVPQQPSVDQTHGFSATLKYQVAPSLELRSFTAWRGVSTNQWDNSGGPERTIFAPNAKFSRYSLSDLYQHQFSQEFQAVGSLPQIDYVVGLYYFAEHATESAATPSSNQWNADGTSYTITNPFVTGPVTSGNQGWAYGSRFLTRASGATAHSYAAYGQATWTPAGFEAAHLTVGGRVTKDDRNGLLYIVNGVATNYTFDFSKTRFDPMVTLAFDATQNVNLYAKYSTGYRAGGANDRSKTFTAFGPESVKAYEIGAKMNLFDHHVRLNLAGYIMDRDNTQTDFDNVDTSPFLADGVTPNPTFNAHTEETRNAPGTSKIRGVEADLTARLTNNLTVGASYAYTYTKIPPTPNPLLPGNPLFTVFTVYTPRNAASGTVDYELPVGGNGAAVRLHLDANYADSQYSFQAENVKTDSSFIVNGRLALANLQLNDHGQRFTIAAWARNLFNESHIYRRSAANSVPSTNPISGAVSYSGVLGDYANFNPPRTWGIEGTLNF